MPATPANPAEQAGHPAPARHAIGAPILIFGLLGAPAATAIETLIGMGVAGRACFPSDHPLASARFDVQPIVWIVHIAALLVAGAAVLASLSAWRQTRHEHPGGRGAMVEVGEGRTRFLAMWALLTSLGFFAAVVFDTPGLIFLRPC